MNEAPKSIWKKSWKGPRAALLRVTVLLIAIWLGMFLIMLVADWTSKMAFVVFLVIGGLTMLSALLFLAYPTICCWKNFRRFLFVFACFATLVALFYAEEDWRGWHAWNQFRHQWEAKGEKFDWQSVVPPPVPDDQNFAMAPIWVELMAAGVGTNFAQAFYGKTPAPQELAKFSDRLQMNVGSWENYNDWPTNGNWETATLTDLKPWQDYYRALAAKTNEFPVARESQTPARDVLLALSKYDWTIEALREAARLPDSRFPLNYDDENPAGITLPHLAVLRRCTQVLQLHAIAELQEGQTDKALADVKLSLRLGDAIRNEPALISHLVRIAVLQITLQPIYEGLAEHKWSDAQLVDLETELTKLNFVADYQLAMHGEMGFQDGIFDYLRRHPNELYNMSGNFGGERKLPLPGRMLVQLIPSGWFYQNQLHCARPMVELILPVGDASRQTISPEKIKKAEATIAAQTRRLNAFNFIERLMLSTLGNTAKRFAYAQASADLARTAIALERYRLAHGGYPDSLDALAPQFMEKIPHDVIGGGPLHYRLDPPSQSSGAASGQFVLYSIGWNERDDGGVVVFRKGSSSNVDINQGDWVWRYPAK
jgi:hypothetical protein